MRLQLSFLVILVLLKEKVITEHVNITLPHNTIFNSTNIAPFNNHTLTANSIQGWRCHCWNSITELESELECRCEGNSLLRIPQQLHYGMKKLTIASAGLPKLRTTGLKAYGFFLQDVMLTDLSEFTHIESSAFENLHILRTIYISNAPKLQYLTADNFKGVSNTLKILKIIYCGLLQVPDLSLLSSDIILHMVDLEGNKISRIETNSVKIKSEQLLLDKNDLQYVGNAGFNNSEIAKLSLKNNRKLRVLDVLAFSGILNILELDLSKTSLEALPTEGLQNLEILRIENTHTLKTIPSVYNFKSLRQAWLTHSFHCCAFKFPSRHDPIRHAEQLIHLTNLQQECINNSGLISNEDKKSSIQDRNMHSKYRRRRWFERPENKSSHENAQYVEGNSNNNFESFNAITGSPVPAEDNNQLDSVYLSNNPDLGEFHESTAEFSNNNILEAICGNLTKNVIDIKCYPVPDALNPCEDVMGSDWLRGSVWLVIFLAVFGNVAVLIVLFSNRNDITVAKFLINHLAFGDFCMGIYLLLLASIDAHSMTEYFNFAYDWQYGSGCKAAGFLTVFASHLSIFTLTIITLERWFAITHAIYLNKRIKLRTAAHIMIVGWIFSIVMATLPLFGFSNYSSTSICLPMEARDSWDVAYLICLLAVNGLAFVIIVICYSQIYFSLGKETRNAARNASGEMTVAKKMALLVFTNFACWAPIAFFGITALAGYPLIDVAKSKILLVFFFPLNSCANPYLYAILTAQYRRDLYFLLSKFGLCTKRAQEYKMAYSLPTTHNTYPLTLIARNSISSQRKLSRPDTGESLV